MAITFFGKQRERNQSGHFFQAQKKPHGFSHLRESSGVTSTKNTKSKAFHQDQIVREKLEANNSHTIATTPNTQKKIAPPGTAKIVSEEEIKITKFKQRVFTSTQIAENIASIRQTNKRRRSLAPGEKKSAVKCTQIQTHNPERVEIVQQRNCFTPVSRGRYEKKKKHLKATTKQKKISRTFQFFVSVKKPSLRSATRKPKKHNAPFWKGNSRRKTAQSTFHPFFAPHRSVVTIFSVSRNFCENKQKQLKFEARTSLARQRQAGNKQKKLTSSRQRSKTPQIIVLHFRLPFIPLFFASRVSVYFSVFLFLILDGRFIFFRCFSSLSFFSCFVSPSKRFLFSFPFFWRAQKQKIKQQWRDSVYFRLIRQLGVGEIL
jgi:hypothetical protein